MDGSDSGGSEPAETYPKNDGAEESNSSAGVAPGAAEPSQTSVPSPAKITVVRSKKTQTELPAMQPPAPAPAPAPAPTPPQGTEGAAVTQKKSLLESSPTLAADSRALENRGPGNPDPSRGQILTGSQSANSNQISTGSQTSNSNQVQTNSRHLPENLSASRQNLNAVNLAAQEVSHTKLSFPAPDQPLPPPQAPPQFLGDQGLNRATENTLDRSQFGTASEFGGAPIALLTNKSRTKDQPQFSFMDVFAFVKANLIACILALSMVVLSVLFCTNRDFRGDSKIEAIKSMDLTILSTGQSLEEVNQLITAKKYQEALTVCDKIIQKDPKFAEGYHARGQVYMATHRYHEAVDDLTTAVSFNHRSADIHIDRAAALFQIQDFEKAKLEYDQIIALDKNSAPAYFGRGLVEENTNKTDAALADFNKTLELQNDYAAANEEMGTIYFSKGELRKSYDEYSKAIALSPEVPRFYFNRANALKQDHQVKRAIADYCKAIQLDATSPEFFNNRGLLYLENNETQKAVTDFSSAVDLDPNYTIAKHNLTLAQERLRR
jgi:tetratricopeptide (TPR) repeat protein